MTARGWSPLTVRQYLRYAYKLREHSRRSPTQWREKDITAWLVHCSEERGNSTNTLSVKFTAIRAMCVWMRASGVREDDPTAGMTPPRRGVTEPRPAPTEVVAAVMRNEDPRVRLAAALAAYAGLRRAEIAALQWGDISSERIYVRHGKGDKSAHAYMHPQILAQLYGYPQAHPDIVIVSRNGEAFTPDGLARMMRPALRAAGLRRGGLHTLRHWFCTSALHAGADLISVSKAARHSNVSTTQRYILVSEERVRAAATAIPAAS